MRRQESHYKIIKHSKNVAPWVVWQLVGINDFQLLGLRFFSCFLQITSKRHSCEGRNL
jgi:lipid-A-disaccharide synthase-like uncharacterized protein